MGRKSRKSGPGPTTTTRGRGEPVASSKMRRPGKPIRPRPRSDRLAESGAAILFGTHAVREAIANPQRTVHNLWCTNAGALSMTDAIEAAAAQGRVVPPPTLCERAELEAHVPPGAVHQGVVASCTPLPEIALEDLLLPANGLAHGAAGRLIVALDQVTDPQNVGAILRTAAAFGAAALIMTERNAPPMSGTLAKVASGAVEHVPICRVTNLARALRALRDRDVTLLGLAEEGPVVLTPAACPPGLVALVLGSEGDGLRRLTRETCDQLVRLPTGGKIASLNVANAAASAMYAIAAATPGPHDLHPTDEAVKS